MIAIQLAQHHARTLGVKILVEDDRALFFYKGEYLGSTIMHHGMISARAANKITEARQ